MMKNTKICHTKIHKEVMTQTNVTTNTAIKCEEILGEKWITDEPLQNYFYTLKNSLKNENALIINALISHAVKHCEYYEYFLELVDI